MSKKVVLRPVESDNRREPLLPKRKSSGKAGTRLGEAVGGAAAVCCCAPCTLANIVYLAIYKVPASICMKALKKRKQRRRRRLQSSGEGMFQTPSRVCCTCGCCEDGGFRVHPTCGTDDDGDDDVAARSSVNEEDKDVMELEKEMWDRFYSTGFWRSPSQRDHHNHNNNNSFSPQRLIAIPIYPSPS